jgi:Ca2+-binding EF-hand superfamily protein
MGCISNDYSTDEEYLNTIAGFGDDDEEEEEEAKKVFQLADLDGSGNISLGEFLKLSREIEANRERLDENLRDPSPLMANRLQELEEKVEENSKKLDRICSILEGRKF